MIKTILLFFIGIIFKAVDIECHGMLLDPPARSSAWREDDKKFPKYYQDNQMFCGGFDTQWRKNKGRCGICGEDWSGTKLFENGGKYYTGLKVRTYKENDEVQVKSEITANHEGFIEYRICNVDKISKGEATQKCLNKMVLKDKYGRSRFRVLPNFVGVITTQLVLPKSLTCNHCVMQWRYHTANSWNVDRYSGRSCKGCGPQEEFYGCADVEILKSTESRKKFGREPSDSDSSQEKSNHSQLLIDLLNELMKLKEQKDNEENSETKRKVESSDEISAYVDLPAVYQKRKTISFPDQPVPSEEFAKKDTMTLNGNLEIFEESDIKTGDPVDDENDTPQATREIGEKPNILVFPDEPRPSEEFFKRGIVNFGEFLSEEEKNNVYPDEARPSEELVNREEEHVGVPLQGQAERENLKAKKLGKDLFYKAIKEIFRRKMAEMKHKIK